MNDKEILAQVIEKAGGLRALGRGLKIKYQAIQNWKRIPPDRVIAIEHLTGISRKHLRPDLYGRPERVDIPELIETIKVIDKMARQVGLNYVPDESQLESLGLSSEEIDFIFASISEANKEQEI